MYRTIIHEKPQRSRRLPQATELDTQLEISKRTELGHVEALENIQTRIIKIQMMLHGLIRSLKQRPK